MLYWWMPVRGELEPSNKFKGSDVSLSKIFYTHCSLLKLVPGTESHLFFQNTTACFTIEPNRIKVSKVMQNINILQSL